MAAHSFEDLKRHVGHTIECVYYGDPDNPISVAIECTTCSEVLLDFDSPDYEENPEPAEEST